MAGKLSQIMQNGLRMVNIQRQHPRADKDERNKRNQNLGYKSQCSFLNLSNRLNQANCQTHGHPNQQYGGTQQNNHVQRFFQRELGFAETAVIFNINDLLSIAAKAS